MTAKIAKTITTALLPTRGWRILQARSGLKKQARRGGNFGIDGLASAGLLIGES
jgi:hypothetical protein